MNVVTVKLEATNFCITILFVSLMPAMSWDIEFPKFYMNLQMPP